MKILANNRRVLFDYFVEDEMVAGVVLLGWEVKSILDNKVSINECYVRVISGELFIVGSTITPLIRTQFLNPDHTRSRKLLVTKHQLKKWGSKVREDGYTLMIKDLHYSDNKKIKATLCLCKGKKQHDRREATKARDIQRDQERA